MTSKIGIEVSIAAAKAAALANVDVVAAYPITPQTHIIEHLAEIIAQGELDAEYIPVESEHSAISACLGASAAGARTFTATASQGLALMHEILFIASSMRLPLVMAVANRAVSGPINIWADHSDIMPQRDTGWIQVFAENGQEVFDLILQSFKVSEDHGVLLPVMVNMDGFCLSHVIEPICLLTKDQVDSFLPQMNPKRFLDPKNPRTMGPFGFQNIYTEVKKQQEEALLQAGKAFSRVWNEFEEKFKRKYNAVETYKTGDADIIVLTMGSVAETARSAVDEMRNSGKKLGLATIRLWRPLPVDELVSALKNAKKIVVLDRMLTPGGQGGPVGLEIRSIFYSRPKRPVILDYVAGLGGREINKSVFKEMVRRSETSGEQPRNFTHLDVRLS